MNGFVINYLIFFVSIIITLASQFYISSTYSKYKKVLNKKHITGFEVARKILDNNGLKDIHIVEVSGELSDHYDPKRKVIRLSRDIFNGESIASASVSAHECGHAIQDKEGYLFLRFRNGIIPFVNICSKLSYISLLIGFFAGILDFVMIGILLLGASLIFQLVTLPVEFDASRRALKEIERLEILDKSEKENGKIMLKAAAFTYVASLVTTILEMLRLFLIARDGDD